MKHLEKKEGYYYYNGDVISDEVFLPDTTDETVWEVITEEKANEIEKAKLEEYKAEQEKLKASSFSLDENNEIIFE